ncbi:MAG: hypothetical protein F6K35_10970 [Okeania sp. SIO2H7]|nr:hypothetical protein [Okeania sp. SIO2H7]
MTLQALFENIIIAREPIILFMLIAPWFTFLLCVIIPGKREEPFLLSVNLTLAVISMLMLAGYLAYATNLGGWAKVVKQADLVLLVLPPYYLISSLWISKRRLPLNDIPAFRTLQGLMVMGGVFLILSWIISRIYFVFFTRLSFSWFLVAIALLLTAGYWGYRKMFD